MKGRVPISVWEAGRDERGDLPLRAVFSRNQHSVAAHERQALDRGRASSRLAFASRGTSGTTARGATRRRSARK